MQHVDPLNGLTQPTCPRDATTGMIECNWAPPTHCNSKLVDQRNLCVLMTNAQASELHDISDARRQPVAAAASQTTVSVTRRHYRAIYARNAATRLSSPHHKYHIVLEALRVLSLERHRFRWSTSFEFAMCRLGPSSLDHSGSRVTRARRLC